MAAVASLAALVAVALATQAQSASHASALAAIADGAAAARARYLEGDFRGAIAAAGLVAEAFEGQPSVRCKSDTYICREGPAYTTAQPAWEAWADAQATKGLAYFRLGNDAAGDDAFRAVIATLPAWSPDRGFMPPKQLARYDAVRQAALAGNTVPVRLIDAGSGGTPVLDGRAVPTSATLDVTPGRHYVGADGYGQVVVVDTGGPLVVPRPRSSATQPPQQPLPAAVAAPSTPEAPAPADEGPVWLAIGGGVAGLTLLTAVVVGVVVALQPRETVPNPGGTTVVVDASRLNEGL